MPSPFSGLRLRLAGLFAGLLIAGSAVALDEVRLLVPAAAGSRWDIAARELGRAMLAAGAARSIRYENRDGAEGAVALAQFAQGSRGDPNVLLLGGMAMIGSAIESKSAAAPAQLTPIARLAADFPVVVVAAHAPVRDLPDLMARFKANPASVSWGGGRAGGTDHMLAAQLARVAGVPPGKLAYVPLTAGGGAIAVTAAPLQAYLSGVKSGQGAAAAILDRTPAPGGASPTLHVGIAPASALARQIRSGEVRALGIAAETRTGATATLKEQGFNVELADWLGVFAAPGITKAQQAALVAAVEAGTRQATWGEALRRQDWTAYWLPGDAFGADVRAETRRIGDILGDLNPGRK